MKFNLTNGTYSQADPYVVKYQDTYYMYSTGSEGVRVFTSKDFKNWEYVGICYSKSNDKEYWAPCIYEEDGTYYLYVSTMDINTDDVHQQRIQVATSKNPLGPFEFKKYLTEPFSIDPHVIRTSKGLYMFYSINDYESERAGTYIVVDRMLNPLEMENDPVEVIKPTIDEEIFMRNRFKEGRHWHTLEGAFYFKEDGCHYLMYSGNCYQNENYYLGYATCLSDEDDLKKIKFKKFPDENTYGPLVRKNEFEEGTGHNSVIKLNGDLYVVYHGRDIKMSETTKDTRTARFLKIKIRNNQLEIVER